MSTTAPPSETSTPLFDRQVQLAVDSLLITDLRVQFKVKKTLRHEPNTCEVSVTNLNEASRAGLQKHKRLKVILSAGYPGNIAQIFSGDSRYSDQIKDGAQWVSKIQCGDGERAYRFARVAGSFAAGASVRDVVSFVSKQMGLTLVGDTRALNAISSQFTQGFTPFGSAKNVLERLLKSNGFEWSIQDGQLQVLQTGDPLPNSAILLGPTTGLIGSPEHGNPEKDVPLPQLSGAGEDNGFQLSAARKVGPAVLKVKSLLQPGLRPGRRVQVQSNGVNGLFRIEMVTHTGDTAGGEWYSEVEALPA